MSFLLVLVTVPNRKIAEKISRALLDKKLCACVNLVKEIDSFFWWQGKVDNECEILMLIKTKTSLFDELKEAVLKLHPYEVPEVVGVNLTHLNQDYADWLAQETK
jgi:periplasmic divalent cation tolerance protein